VKEDPKGTLVMMSKKPAGKGVVTGRNPGGKKGGGAGFAFKRHVNLEEDEFVHWRKSVISLGAACNGSLSGDLSEV